jgi:cytochrome c6
MLKRKEKGMKTVLLMTILVMGCLCLHVLIVEAQEDIGETLFNDNCVVCHPGGGNVINPQKTLHSGDLKANNITKQEDVIAIMRNPGPGMSKFDNDKIPDYFAAKIAEYILKTFK